MNLETATREYALAAARMIESNGVRATALVMGATGKELVHALGTFGWVLPEWHRADIDWVCEQYVAGTNLADIATAVARQKTAIYALARRQGLERPPEAKVPKPKIEAAPIPTKIRAPHDAYPSPEQQKIDDIEARWGARLRGRRFTDQQLKEQPYRPRTYRGDVEMRGGGSSAMCVDA